MKFRKKPVVIDAVQWDGTTRGAEVVAAFIGAHHGTLRGREWVIRTLEGTMTAQPHDWIIKGVKDEFYPCKPDIFAATYEPVDELAPPGRDTET